MTPSMASITGTAQAKMSWKKTTMIVAKSAVPQTGWRTTRSTASVKRLCPGRLRTTWARIESDQAARARGRGGGGIG